MPSTDTFRRTWRPVGPSVRSDGTERARVHANLPPLTETHRHGLNLGRDIGVTLLTGGRHPHDIRGERHGSVTGARPVRKGPARTGYAAAPPHRRVPPRGFGHRPRPTRPGLPWPGTGVRGRARPIRCWFQRTRRFPAADVLPRPRPPDDARADQRTGAGLAGHD